MAQCPRCKEDMPLLSKVCSVCGYIQEGDSEANVEQLIDNLEKNLHDLKKIPEPTFGKGLSELSHIIVLFLAILSLSLAIISEAGLFWIIFGIFAFWTVYIFIKKIRGELGNAPYNKQFKAIKTEYEYNERIAKRNFGKNREVSNLIKEINQNLNDVEEKRKNASRKSTIVVAFIIIAIVVACVLFFTTVHNFVNNDSVVNEITETELATTTESGAEKLMSDYINSDKSSSSAEQKRIDVIKALLSENKASAAENFFFENCMGNTKDYDCALLIVNYYKGKSQTDKAKQFTDKSTGLRYKSDKEKLEKTLK